MANALLNAQKIANRALAHLENECVLSQKVHRDYESDFSGDPSGDTVLIRKPATFKAKKFDRATGTEVQSISEGNVAVTLDDILDITVGVTDEELTLDIDSFDERVLKGMMYGIVEGVEEKVAALRDDLVASVGGNGSPEALASAGAMLTAKHVPLAERVAIIGPGTNKAWVTSDNFSRVDASGSTDGLREASLGRVYGFDTFQSATLAEENPADEVGLAYHRSALALVTRTLALPEGARGAVASRNGFGVRVIFEHSAKFKQQTISVDLMVGTKVIDANRAVLISA